MNFIAILITFALLQYWGSFSLLQKDTWFDLLLEKSHRLMGNPWLIYTVSVLFPCLLLVSILVVFRERANGLFTLLLSIAILVYSLGRTIDKDIMEKYTALWEKAEYDQLSPILEVLDNGRCDESAGSLQRLHVNVREAFVYAQFQGLFAVLFWFVVLGPAGAFLYRLNMFFTVKDGWIMSKTIQAILEWPVACISSLFFSFMGDFDKGIPVWRQTAFNLGVTSKNMVHANALAVIGLNMDWLKGEFAEKNSLELQAVLVKDEISDLVQLMRRSLVFFIILIALVQIFI